MENPNKKLGTVVYNFMIFKGVALIVTGLILLFFPQATIVTLIFIMGVYWVIDGVATIIKSLNGRKAYKGWGWGIFAGSLGLFAGLVVLSGPTLSAIFTTTFLMLFVGISAIIYGVSEVVTGYRLPSGTGKSSMVWGGLFSIIFGAMLLASPYTSAVSIIIVLGVFTIISGVLLLVVGNKMRKVIKENY